MLLLYFLFLPVWCHKIFNYTQWDLYNDTDFKIFLENETGGRKAEKKKVGRSDEGIIEAVELAPDE